MDHQYMANLLLAIPILPLMSALVLILTPLFSINLPLYQACFETRTNAPHAIDSETLSGKESLVGIDKTSDEAE